MSDQLSIDEGRGRLAGELTIYQAAALKAALVEAVAAQPELELDLSGVTELDTAGLQLLLMARQYAARAGGALTLVGHSEPVREVLSLLDLADELGEPALLPARERRA
jgi:anti-sigma B factor antagonist